MGYACSNQVTIADVIMETIKHGNLHLRAIATERVFQKSYHLWLQLEFILQCLNEITYTSLDGVTTPDPFLVLVPLFFRILTLTIVELKVRGFLTVVFNYLFLVAAINGLHDFLYHNFAFRKTCGKGIANFWNQEWFVMAYFIGSYGSYGSYGSCHQTLTFGYVSYGSF